MADATQQLVVDLEARITQFERAMARASKVAGENYSAIEARGKRSAQILDGHFGNVGKNAKRNAANLNEAFDTSKAAGAARLTHMQFQILSGAARDAFASIASGQSVMTVLAQQGSNVQAAIGEDGVLGLLGGIGNGLKGLITPATAAMAAIVAIGAGGAYAFSRFRDEQIETELRLTGIGRAAGLTVDDIRRMGDEIANTARISTGSARDIASALAGTGKLGSDNIAAMASLAPGYSRMFGGSLSDAGKALAGIFTDPAKGAEQLDARLGMLDDRTRRYIATLVAQGEKQKAVQVLVAAVQPELQRAADLTSAWARAWEAVKSGADGALNAVGRTVDRMANGPSPAERLAQLRAQRDGSESDYVAELKRQGLDERTIASIVPSYRRDTKALDDEIAALERQIEAERELARVRAEDVRTNAASKQAGDIVAALSEEGEAIKALQDRYVALGKALDDPAIVAKLDDADKARAAYEALGKRVEELTADYKAGGAAAAQALRAANFSAATAGLDSYRKGLAAINREYDEQIRLARQAGDAAATAARVATLEAARGAAVRAYNVESRERARSSVAMPGDYAASVIAAESAGDDAAKNPRSSATGAGQFISSTWLTLFKRVYSDMAATLSDDAILALRRNREYSARLIEEYARENALRLQEAGFEGTSANLHLAHFLGPAGAISMLRANPNAKAASILPAAARSNPEVFRKGAASVQDILDYAERRAQRGSSSGRATLDRVTALRAEAEAYGKTAIEAERLKAIEEQLAADREVGGQLGDKFKSAQDLIKASSDQLTPALKAQRDEVLALADARAKAAATGLGARFDRDMAEQRGALGRTDAEQRVYSTVRSYGFDYESDAGRSAAAVVRLNNAMADLKSTASGALSGFASDLLHGASAAEALRNQLIRIADKLIQIAVDQLVSAAFGGLMGGSGSKGGGFNLFSAIGSIFGFAEGGHVTGPGTGTSDSIPAMLSNGEYVVRASQVAKHRALLDAINSGSISQFASGGLVGTPALPSAALSGPAGTGSVTIAPNISVTVEGGSRGAEADRELGSEVARQIERQIRGMMTEEIRRQIRPGGILR